MRKKTALLLAASLLLGLLAGCGSKEDNSQQLSATVYVPKYLDLDLDANYINDGCSDGEYLYLIAEKDEDVRIPGNGEDGIDEYYIQRSDFSIYRVSLADGTAEKLPGYIGPTVPEGKDGSNSVSQIAAGKDGTLWVTERVFIWGDINAGGYDGTVDAGRLPASSIMRAVAASSASAEPAEEEEDNIDDEAEDADTEDVAVDEPADYTDEYHENVIRRQLDKDGNELSRIDLSHLEEALSGLLGEDDYLNMQSFDSEGNLYVGTDTKIYALNSDLSVRFTVEGKDMWYDLTALSGGLMGMQIWEYDEVNETSTNKIKTLDPETQDWGPEYILPNNAYGNIYPGGGDYLFYYRINDSIFGYKAGETSADGIGTGEGERLFSWIEADLNSENVRTFFFLPDGRVAAIMQEWDENYEHLNISVVLMTATPRSELPEKTTLIYATMYLNYDARRRILEFNKRSETYRIEVKDYSEYMDTDPTGNAALQKLNTEILAGNVPDILDTGSLPVRQYGAKDILEDLWPYIDKDPDLSRDNLLLRPLEANQQDGKLYEIFSTFSIRSVVGPTSVVGDRTSWTLADLREALARMPEGCSIFGETDTKANMLATLVAMNMDQYVNWEEGTCSFDSPDFKAILEFCSGFPEKFDWENVNWDEWEEEESRVISGKQMLLAPYLYDFDWNLHRVKALFNDEYSFVGYPKEDGGCGSSFVPGRGVAMTKACKDKEGAWSYIRQILLPTSEMNARYYYGEFPINKKDFDLMIDTALSSRYETDKEGNPILDDDGNPIPTQFGSMWISDDLQIDFGPIEQSDIDKVMDLYNTIDSIYRNDEKIMEAVNEVAGQYFAGDKPLDETASLIQNKVKLYIGENL